jgi:glycosyltransferase involved in cell wall biosynthesis
LEKSPEYAILDENDQKTERKTLVLDKIAVLIPCYNEEKTVEKVVRDFHKVLPEAVIYVYDNNSSDRTVELAQKAGAVVRHEYQQGKGNVIRRMFREIDAQVYVMTDGDDTYPAECAREMVNKVLEHQADMVVGDRLSSTYFTENKRPFHNFGNSLVRGSINRLFHTEIKDIMTGYRAFSYQFVKTFPVLSKGFEIETEMTIHAADKNMQVDNVVIEYRDRPEGSTSKLNTYSDGAKVLMSIAKLYRNYKPMNFFGLLSLVLAVVSVIFFIPVLTEYIATGLVPKFPTLIVCGFALMAALQSVFAGLILSAGAQRSRQEFEMNLIKVDMQYKELLKDEES